MALESVASALAAENRSRVDFAPGERGEGQWTNELFGRGRQDDVDGEASFHQGASQLRGLICRYASADAKRDVHANTAEMRARNKLAAKNPALFLRRNHLLMTQ